MAIEKRMCAFHADRLAIGVCVETKMPICGECSTRYEGVNYSKEGLRRLQARRAPKKKTGDGWFARHFSTVFFSLITVICLWCTYYGYYYTFIATTDVIYPDTATEFNVKQLLSELDD